MSSESTLILFGIFVAITPYSGVPIFWYAYMLPVFGIIIIGLGFLFRSRRVSSEKTNDKTPMSHQPQESEKPQVMHEHMQSASSSSPETTATSKQKDSKPISQE